MQDSPIKSNAERYADYLDQRQAGILLMRMEKAEAVNRLMKQGLSKAEAEDVVNKSTKQGKSPLDSIKKFKVSGRGKTLAKVGVRSLFVVGWPLILVSLACLMLFFFISFVSGLTQKPEAWGKFINKECLDTALGNSQASVDCLKQIVQQNNQNAYENQGLTI